MKNQLTRSQNIWESFLNDEMFGYGTDIDIYHEGANFIVEADLPGFNKEDIEIDFKGDILTLKAEHNEVSEDSGTKNYYYRSRTSKKFYKQIRFADVDATDISASYDNGVLKVSLPTKIEEEVVNSRIEVK